MFFVVSVEREYEPAVVGYVPNKSEAASIDMVVAVSLAESFELSMIIVRVVPSVPVMPSTAV